MLFYFAYQKSIDYVMFISDNQVFSLLTNGAVDVARTEFFIKNRII